MKVLPTSQNLLISYLVCLEVSYKSRVQMLLTERQRQARIAAARLTHKAILPKTWLQTNPGFIRMASLKRNIKSFGHSIRKLLSLFQANWSL